MNDNNTTQYHNPAPSPWIAFSERKPTEADGTYVWVIGPDQLIPGAWNLPTNSVMYPYTHWMPASAIPPLPVEREKSQEEKDNEAAQAWWKESQTPFKNQMAYAHQLDHGWLERQAFLAGLRHARAQGKEGV